MKPAIKFALAATGVLFAVSIAATVAHKTGYIDQDMTTRILMVSLGVFMVAQSSRSPKDDLKRTARGIAIQRFTGWAMTLAGLAWTVIWVLVPVDQATLLSMAPFGIALAAVIARCFVGRAKTA